MEHPPQDFDQISEPLEHQVAAGLSKIAGALQAHAWQGASETGLTPTQGRALALLRGELDGLRVGALAAALAVSAPTASDALSSLVAKGLVIRQADPADRRAAAFRLTEAGNVAATEAASWPDFLATAVLSLSVVERTVLYRALIKVIRSMQEAGDINAQRLCVSCRYFQPYVRADDPDRPHVCALVGAPFGDRHLRLDCREHDPAADEQREMVWRLFADPAPSKGTYQ